MEGEYGEIKGGLQEESDAQKNIFTEYILLKNNNIYTCGLADRRRRDNVNPSIACDKSARP